MKKLLLFLALTVFAGFALTGCSQGTDNSAEATTTQEIASDASDTENAADASTEQASSTAAQKSDDDNYDFSSYEVRIEKDTKNVNNAKASSNYKTNQDRYYSLKRQIDAIEDDLDALDDTFEHSYESGDMTFETYQARERSIDKLEDQLELSEDALENKFGIDD